MRTTTIGRSTRRRLLGALAAAAVGAATLVAVPTTASAAEPWDGMRARWAANLIGESYDPTAPAIAARLDTVEATAQGWWDTMDASPTSPQLWPDVIPPPDDEDEDEDEEEAAVWRSSQLTLGYTRLRDMAVAASAVGSDLYGDLELIGDIIDGLVWMQANIYNGGSSVVDNWWDWGMGAPMALIDTVVLMHDHLTQAQIVALMAGPQKFGPEVTSDLTGANRAWKAEVVAGWAMLLGDEAKLAQTRDRLSPLFDYVTAGDGFYRDGSFIQHHTIPYNGSYGRSVVTATADLLAVLRGSPWAVTDPDLANMYAWVTEAFEPLIHDGVLMDMVRGREITRHYFQDVDAGRGAMEMILALAESAETGLATRFRAMVKAWLTADSAHFFATASFPGIVRAVEVLSSSAPPRPPLVDYHQFANMDRAVAHRDGWAVGLAMSSQRIALYESINQENRRGWYTGVGTLYLYNQDRTHYSDNYWPTVNPYRMPGTTVDVRSRTDGANNVHLSNRSWVGGVAMGPFGASGLDYADAGGDLTAKKSWFVFDDEIVALGAGITSTSGRRIETIVENRMLGGAATNEVRIQGTLQSTTPATASSTQSGVTRLYVRGTQPGAHVGYYFPQPVQIHHQREQRSGRWSTVDTRTTTPTTLHTRTYQNFWLSHGTNPSNATYAYTMLPNKTSAQVDAYASSPQIQVLANTATAQGVAETGLGIQAANFWTDTSATAGLITSNKKSSVMLRRSDGHIALAVSDPTQAASGTVRVQLALSAATLVEADSRVTVVSMNPLTVDIDVVGADGASIEALFTEGTPVTWNLLNDDMTTAFSNGWTSTNDGGVQEPGYVAIVDDSDMSQSINRPFTSPSGAFTIEARLRVHEGQAGFSVRGASHLVKTGLQHGTSGSATSATGARTHALDTTTWRVYRMVVHADRTSDLYVDGVRVWQNAPAGAGGTSLLVFGLGGPEKGKFDVDFVRAATGAIIP